MPVGDVEAAWRGRLSGWPYVPRSRGSALGRRCYPILVISDPIWGTRKRGGVVWAFVRCAERT